MPLVEAMPAEVPRTAAMPWGVAMSSVAVGHSQLAGRRRAAVGHEMATGHGAAHGGATGQWSLDCRHHVACGLVAARDVSAAHGITAANDIAATQDIAAARDMAVRHRWNSRLERNDIVNVCVSPSDCSSRLLDSSPLSALAYAPLEPLWRSGCQKPFPRSTQGARPCRNMACVSSNKSTMCIGSETPAAQAPIQFGRGRPIYRPLLVAGTGTAVKPSETTSTWHSACRRRCHQGWPWAAATPLVAAMSVVVPRTAAMP